MSPGPNPESASTSVLESQARAAADQFRRDHGFGLAPLGDLVALIELTLGVDVAILAAPPDSHGMTLRDPERDVVMVAAARTRNPMRQRSTLAHELAHIVFNDYAEPRASGWGRRDPEEVRADNFARNLIVPLGDLGEVAADVSQHGPSELSTLSALVQHFLASPAIVAIQLANAGMISEELKTEWVATMTAPKLAGKFGWADQYRLMQHESHARRAPQRLLARAVDGYTRGIVSVAYIARLRGMGVAEVEAEFAEQGIEPISDDSGENLEALLPPEQPLTDVSDLDALGLDEVDPDEELPPE